MFCCVLHGINSDPFGFPGRWLVCVYRPVGQPNAPLEADNQ